VLHQHLDNVSRLAGCPYSPIKPQILLSARLAKARLPTALNQNFLSFVP
jgi:hypothetical protein